MNNKFVGTYFLCYITNQIQGGTEKYLSCLRRNLKKMVFDHLDIFKKLNELKYFSAHLHSFNRKKCDEDDYDDPDHDHQQQ